MKRNTTDPQVSGPLLPNIFRNFVKLKPFTIGEQIGTPEGKARRWTIYNPHLLSTHNLHKSREAITVNMQGRESMGCHC